jgi:putative ABC transport system permease protein
VAGRAPLLVINAYDGDASWLGWNLLAGHWYAGPGEVAASSQLLAETGLKVGGSIILTVNGKPVTATIAGKVFQPGPPHVVHLLADPRRHAPPR